ncbi:MAG: Fe-S cluster assembly protein SufD [Pseudanabaenaceae cyanobacterium]
MNPLTETWLQGRSPAVTPWLGEFRRAQEQRLGLLTFPTPRDEGWQQTDLTGLQDWAWQPQGTVRAAGELASLVTAWLPTEAAGRTIALWGNEVLLRPTELPTGVSLQLLSETQRIPEHFAQHTDATDYFATLNGACGAEGVLLTVGPAVTAGIVAIATVGTVLPTADFPRMLVTVAPGSSLTLVEMAIGADDRPYFRNSVTEVWLAEGATCEHLVLQAEGERAVRVTATAVSQGRHSRYHHQAIALGGKITRHNLWVRPTGEATATHLAGLTLLGGDRLTDTHTTLFLDYPHSYSRQRYKCAAGGRSRGIFHGKIVVGKAAQHTDAAQLSRGLLLSHGARIHTEPQLEIFADDVKCAHGATVSQLDAEELFYLRSRGLDHTGAIRLLVNGFAGEVLQQIAVPSLRTRLEKLAGDRLQAQILG